MKSHKDCSHCSGSGKVAIAHNAWIEDGYIKGEDVFEDCDECEGHFINEEREEIA